MPLYRYNFTSSSPAKNNSFHKLQLFQLSRAEHRTTNSLYSPSILTSKWESWKYSMFSSFIFIFKHSPCFVVTWEFFLICHKQSSERRKVAPPAYVYVSGLALYTRWPYNALWYFRSFEVCSNIKCPVFVRGDQNSFYSELNNWCLKLSEIYLVLFLSMF